MKALLLLLALITASKACAADLGFYDADNSCSLGCGCSWSIHTPASAIIYRARRAKKSRYDDEVVFNKSLLVRPGSTVDFRLSQVPKNGIGFGGFSLDGGSCDGRAACSLPKCVTILRNGKVVETKVLKRTKDRQTIEFPYITVFDGDTVSIRFNNGYTPNKPIGFTYLVPNGGH